MYQQQPKAKASKKKKNSVPIVNDKKAAKASDKQAVVSDGKRRHPDESLSKKPASSEQARCASNRFLRYW